MPHDAYAEDAIKIHLCSSFVTSNNVHKRWLVQESSMCGEEQFPTNARKIFMQRLKENLQILNLRIWRDVLGNENCFFHATCDQLERLGSEG